MDIQSATTAANRWVDHARPVIKAYLAMHDAMMAPDICAVHYGKDAVSKAKTSDYREADSYIKEAASSLFNMLDGIRDNYLCGQRKSCLVGMSDAEINTVDAFNDELDEAVMSVDAAVRIVEGEV